MAADLAVNIEMVREAAGRIADRVRRTPLLRADKLDDLTGAQVYLKPESLQITGSFKLRGAMNKIMSLSAPEREKGLVAASSGNHAQGVAYAARSLGVKATVIMPVHAPQIKVDGAKSLGAEVILHGKSASERYEKLYELTARHGYTPVHSYDDPDLVAGQGTAGLEIMEDLADAGTVVVPLGGGGLMAGIAVAVKESNPRTRVIGVEPEKIARYSASRKAGKLVDVEPGPTLADGLMITQPGKHVYPIIEKYVDEVVAASDPFIQKAFAEILFKGKVLAEPSSVIGLAALMEGNFKAKRGEKICFFLSGGNVDPAKLLSLLEA